MSSSDVAPKVVEKPPVTHGWRLLRTFLLPSEPLYVTKLAHVDDELKCITYLNLKLFKVSSFVIIYARNAHFVSFFRSLCHGRDVDYLLIISLYLKPFSDIMTNIFKSCFIPPSRWILKLVWSRIGITTSACGAGIGRCGSRPGIQSRLGCPRRRLVNCTLRISGRRLWVAWFRRRGRHSANKKAVSACEILLCHRWIVYMWLDNISLKIGWNTCAYQIANMYS